MSLMLLSNNRDVQFRFSEYCKKNNFEFFIIQENLDFINYGESIKSSFIIFDCENFGDIAFANRVINLKAVQGNVIEIFKDGIIKDIETAITIIEYKLLSGNLFYDTVDVEAVARDVLNKYNFKIGYAGHNYLVAIIVNEFNTFLNFAKFSTMIENVSKSFGNKSKVAILRDLRYLMSINRNSVIINVRGGENEVKVKLVVLFLLCEVKNEIDRRMNLKNYKN